MIIRFVAPPPTDADRPKKRGDREPKTRVSGDCVERQCSDCHRWLPQTKQFFQWSSCNPTMEKLNWRSGSKEYYRIQKDHWSSECKECRKAKVYARIAAKRQASPLVAKWHDVCGRAKRVGINFTRECPWTMEEMPTVCPVLGITLTYPKKVGANPGWARKANGKRKDKQKRNANDAAISADRIDPSDDVGYIRPNVVWVSYRTNRIKNDATPEESLRVAAYSYRESAKRGLVPCDPIQDLIDAASGSTDPAIMGALDAFKRAANR